MSSLPAPRSCPAMLHASSLKPIQNDVSRRACSYQATSDVTVSCWARQQQGLAFHWTMARTH
eukprot:6685019-Pyramimonas_sp.AAC.1